MVAWAAHERGQTNTASTCGLKPTNTHSLDSSNVFFLVHNSKPTQITLLLWKLYWKELPFLGFNEYWIAGSCWIYSSVSFQAVLARNQLETLLSIVSLKQWITPLTMKLYLLSTMFVPWPVRQQVLQQLWCNAIPMSATRHLVPVSGGQQDGQDGGFPNLTCS